MTQKTLTYISDVSSVLGLVVSIIGLCLTIAVYQKVRRLQEDYVFRGRLLVLIEDLTHHASRIVEYHRDFDNVKNEINVEIAMARATIRSLGKKLDRAEKLSVQHLTEKIDSYTISQGKDSLFAIYVQMQVMCRCRKSFTI